MDALETAEVFISTTRRYLKILQESPENRQEFDRFQAEYKRLFEKLLPAAQSSHPEIWLALGIGFFRGHGTRRNEQKAESLFRRAALAGNLEAMVELAWLLERQDRSEDYREAVTWLTRAADAGSSNAMFSLGYGHRKGLWGLPKNPEIAVDWFMKCYDAGADSAAIFIALIFHHASTPSIAEAELWYRRAAEDAPERSYIGLATLFDDRRLECYDPAEAVKWYQTVVAKCGPSPRALMALALHYWNGEGVPPCSRIARVWLDRLLAETPLGSEPHRRAQELLTKIEEATA